MNSIPDPSFECQRDWRPVAGRPMLEQRARLLTEIRRFMTRRGILEVETPMLSEAAVSDPALESLEVTDKGCTRYLQTSPEFAMKRLLAAGSGPIYQIARVFRDGERGRWHHPEFTLLEWYRPGYDAAAMLDEIDALLEVLGLPSARRFSYTGLFLQALGCDPHQAARSTLLRLAGERGLQSCDLSQCELLDFLFSEALVPLLKQTRCAVVYDFPVLQAALARVRPSSDGKPPVAERFELFIDGVETGNGFHELTDAREQRGRFLADQTERQHRGHPQRPIDERLLAALEHGLPDCCGMAIGLDRLLMCLTGANHIDEVLAFPCERA